MTRKMPGATRLLIAVIAALAIAAVPMERGAGPPTASPDGCEQCHEDFVPFVVAAIAPKEMEPGKPVTLRCVITNTGDHDVTDVVAMIKGVEGGEPVVESESFTGTVSRTSSHGHTFEVGPGATSMGIYMIEDPGTLGQGDASLRLITPGEQMFTSDSGGGSEEIVLNEEQMMSAGAGTFSLAVEQVAGLRAVAYDIDVAVEYANAELRAELDDIPPGTSTEAEWTLTLTEEEMDTVAAEVTGTAAYPHDDDAQEQEYTIGVRFEAGARVLSGNDEQRYTIKTIRNALGYVLIGLFMASLFTGFPPTRKLMRLTPKGVLKLHCVLSWSIVIVISAHAYLAFLRHPWWSTTCITGETMTVIFLVLSIMPSIDWFRSGFRVDLKKRLCGKYMMAVNKVAVLVALAVLVVHLVY